MLTEVCTEYTQSKYAQNEYTHTPRTMPTQTVHACAHSSSRNGWEADYTVLHSSYIIGII